MRLFLAGGALIFAGALCLAHGEAQAAAFRAAYPACHDKGAFAKTSKSPGDKPNASEIAAMKARIDAGECLNFRKGETVSIDERDGALWCVRRTGDLDCYWTPSKAVDPNPPIVSSGGGGGGGSGRKGRR
jgi:hypothetical protein